MRRITVVRGLLNTVERVGRSKNGNSQYRLNLTGAVNEDGDNAIAGFFSVLTEEDGALSYSVENYAGKWVRLRVEQKRVHQYAIAITEDKP